MNARTRIACVHYIFLPVGQTWVFEELRNMNRFEPVILCMWTNNLDKFSTPQILRNLRSFYSYYSRAKAPTKFFNKMFFKITKHSLLSLPYNPSLSSFYSKVVKTEDVQLVRAWEGVEGRNTLFLKRKFHLPYITSFHGGDLYVPPRQKPGLYKRLIEEGDLFLVRCRSMGEDLKSLGCPAEKIRVHHSGVDLEKFSFHTRKPVGKDERIKVLFVGRFAEKKGIPDAIKAFAKTKKIHKNIMLVIIGFGPLQHEIEELIQKLGLSKDVFLLGYQPHSEVAKIIIESHIFIQPSVTATDGNKEGIPNTLIEAQATGMPVISTYHAGIPELVLDGQSGYLVPEGDVDGLSEKLDYLIENQNLWEEMGKTGRKKVEEEFDIRKQVTKIEKLYAEMLTKS